MAWHLVGQAEAGGDKRAARNGNQPLLSFSIQTQTWELEVWSLTRTFWFKL